MYFFVLVCCSREGDALFKGHGEYSVWRKTSDGKKGTLRDRRKTLSVLEENVEIPFPLIYFDLGIRKLYRVYRFIYAKESEKNFFGTYRFPVTTGIGAIHEDPDMVIDETSDLITIFYNKEPVDGFFIEKNLFSQKLLFVLKPNLSELKNKDGVCYY